MPIRPFLNGQTFDPETARLVGIAFETARAAIKRRADLSDEMIARTLEDGGQVYPVQDGLSRVAARLRFPVAQ